MAQMSHTRSYAGSDIAETITQMETQWASAAKANDPAKIAPLLADVFISMDADGAMHSKSETLSRIKGDKWQVNEISDVKVLVHGNMAIATGAWQGKGTLANGKTIDAHDRWLDTWIRNGKWECIASASAPAKM